MVGSFDPKIVKELTEMGFSSEQVEEALSVCEGDKNNAVQYLTN
jgi:hypothetical protein